ncbi:hypothetical protein Q3C01_41000 [Bradyrhizobium sp. UFLA05-109]
MKRLILTSSSGFALAKSALAEIVVMFSFRFQWGPVPPPEMLVAYFAARVRGHFHRVIIGRIGGSAGRAPSGTAKIYPLSIFANRTT